MTPFGLSWHNATVHKRAELPALTWRLTMTSKPHTLNADSLLDELDTPADPLEDLYQEAALAHAAKNPKTRRTSDPTLRHALDAATKTMRELYTLPENWRRTQGVALIDH